MASYYETARMVQAAERAQRETSRQAFKIADISRAQSVWMAKRQRALIHGNQTAIANCNEILAKLGAEKAKANSARMRAFHRWQDLRAKLGA